MDRETEKRIKQLENEWNSRLEYMEQSFRTFREIIRKMQRENEELKKDRKIIMEQQKELIRKISLSKNRLAKDVKTFLNPEVESEPVKPIKTLKEKFFDNVSLIKTISRDKSIDNLYEMIMKKGSVKINDAAHKMNVHRIQIEEWAKNLEDNNLIKREGEFLKKVGVKDRKDEEDEYVIYGKNI